MRVHRDHARPRLALRRAQRARRPLPAVQAGAAPTRPGRPPPELRPRPVPLVPLGRDREAPARRLERHPSVLTEPRRAQRSPRGEPPCVHAPSTDAAGNTAHAVCASRTTTARTARSPPHASSAITAVHRSTHATMNSSVARASTAHSPATTHPPIHDKPRPKLCASAGPAPGLRSRNADSAACCSSPMAEGSLTACTARTSALIALSTLLRHLEPSHAASAARPSLAKDAASVSARVLAACTARSCA